MNQPTESPSPSPLRKSLEPCCEYCGSATHPALRDDYWRCGSMVNAKDNHKRSTRCRITERDQLRMAVAQQQEDTRMLKEENKRLREILEETISHIGRNVVCAYPYCGCDGNRNCDAINGPSTRAVQQNIEGKINPAAAIADAMSKEAL